MLASKYQITDYFINILPNLFGKIRRYFSYTPHNEPLNQMYLKKIMNRQLKLTRVKPDILPRYILYKYIG